MRSTGEVLGLSTSVGRAYCKAQEGANIHLPESGKVFISINDKDKQSMLEAATKFKKLGYELVATAGTHKFLANNGVESTLVKKMHEGRPNISDNLTNNEIAIVINTASDKQSKLDDSYIRKTAVKKNIPCFTTAAAANAVVNGLFELAYNAREVKSLQDYHKEISE